MEKILESGYKSVKLRPVVRAAGWIFAVWGAVIFIKGILDALVFDPDSEFVTLKQWIVYARFEMVYGIVCLVFGMLILEFSKRVKERIMKKIEPPLEL